MAASVVYKIRFMLELLMAFDLTRVLDKGRTDPMNVAMAPRRLKLHKYCKDLLRRRIVPLAGLHHESLLLRRDLNGPESRAARWTV